MSEKYPSAEAIALVLRIKGIFRHGHEHDEADALALDAFAERIRAAPSPPRALTTELAPPEEPQ